MKQRTMYETEPRKKQVKILTWKTYLKIFLSCLKEYAMLLHYFLKGLHAQPRVSSIHSCAQTQKDTVTTQTHSLE